MSRCWTEETIIIPSHSPSPSLRALALSLSLPLLLSLSLSLSLSSFLQGRWGGLHCLNCIYCALSRSFAYSRTHTHTYTHMHAHTNTHTYTHTPQQFPNTLTSVTANARRIQTSTVDTATAEGVEAVMEAARAALSVMSWPGVHRPRAGSLCQPVNHPLAWRIRQAWQGSAT